MRPETKRKLDQIAQQERWWWLSAPAILSFVCGATITVAIMWPGPRKVIELVGALFLAGEVIAAAVCWWFNLGDWRWLARRATVDVLVSNDGALATGLLDVTVPPECGDAGPTDGSVCMD